MPAPPLKITVLGSGTSVGVPTIGCHCAVCTSNDPRDNRLRPSILIGYAGRNVLIDTTPDFRTPALRAKIARLDAVLFTHAHADHVMGLDDLRPFNFRQSGPIPIYASAETMAAIQRGFPYIFDGGKKESNVPRLDARLIDGAPIDLFGLEFLPVPVLHGSQTIYGFRFGAAAYLTDHSDIPESSLEMLRSLDVLFSTRCATSRTPRIPPWTDPSRPWKSWRRSAPSSRTSVTTWRTSAPKAFCRRTSGWRATASKSWWEAWPDP